MILIKIHKYPKPELDELKVVILFIRIVTKASLGFYDNVNLFCFNEGCIVAGGYSTGKRKKKGNEA